MVPTVVSLWIVGDVAIHRLMERFYRDYRQKKMSELEALPEAHARQKSGPPFSLSSDRFAILRPRRS